MMMMKKKKVIISTIEQDSYLTEDLILGILPYLPPITLCRFKSVSKTWYSLISNPDFCRRHTALYQFHSSNRCRDRIHDHHYMLEVPFSPGILLRRNCFWGGRNTNIVIHPQPRGLDHEQKNLALLLQNLNDYRPAIYVSSALLKHETLKLIDSCNGLLLYVHNLPRTGEEKRETVFYVCNPITKDYIRLPSIDIIDEFKEEEQEDRIAHIVFNPSFSLTYKVFTWVQCVKQSRSRSDFSQYYRRRLYVYSSEARSWRPSVSIPKLSHFSLFFSLEFKAVLWNGVLHWTSLTSGSSSTRDVLSLCYDIEKEIVWTMKFPKMATGFTRRRLLYFGLCGERLLMIETQTKHVLMIETQTKHDCFPSSFDVLEKQEHNGDENEDMWTVRYHVNFKEVDNDFYSIRSCSSIFICDICRTTRTKKTKNEEVVEEEEEVMVMKVGPVGSGRDNRIIFFNLTSNTFENEKLPYTVLPNTGIPNIGFLNYTDILQYNVTLFPP